MKLPEMGLHEGVPFDVYQSWEAVSNSRLSLFAISPAHYQVGYKAPTKSMDTGSVVHSVVLEDAQYAVIPPFHLDEENKTKKGETPENPKATKYYRHKVELFAAAHEHESIVSQDTYDMAMGVRQAISNHESSKDAFTGGQAEVSLLSRNPETGLVLKGRVDYLHKKRFIDLKTTSSAMNFEASIRKFGYHRQMCLYMELLRACTGQHYEPWICAVETDPPYGVRCAPVGMDALAEGHDELHSYLEDLSECQFLDKWPCYDDPVEWNLPE